MGAHGGQRLARMPQLPRIPGDGLHETEQARRRCPLEHARQGRAHLHRLPQGHRPPAAGHDETMMDEEKQRRTEEFRSWLFLTVFMAPILAVLIVSGWGFVVW